MVGEGGGQGEQEGEDVEIKAEGEGKKRGEGDREKNGEEEKVISIYIPPQIVIKPTWPRERQPIRTLRNSHVMEVSLPILLVEVAIRCSSLQI